MKTKMNIRNVQPIDYQPIISVLDEWWGGRQMSNMLPKLFFIHFCKTSFIAEINSQVIGFLIGFVSQTYPEEAYIHFVGIDPDFRKQRIGSTLYNQFFQTTEKLGCVRIRCVTSPTNQDSIAYHLHMGFEAEPSATQADGIPYHMNYDGAGQHRVCFVKHLIR
ncbi:GNAT family N-acetyltransferase [Leptolyngbyaceae cyanobacterium UHCC 1019]